MAFDISKAAYGKSSMSNLDKIKMIPLDHIEPNEKNFYALSKIEDLMESIRMVGLLDPVRVVPMEEPGYYRLVSGHRRYDAFLELDAEAPHGQASPYARIPALVLEDMDDLTESFALITANSTARELTYDEKLEQEKQLRATLLAMKAEGREVPKNLGQYIADQIGVSRNEVSRMHSVNENLIPEAREKVAAGEMTAQQAYEMSRMPAEEQRSGLSKSLDSLDRITFGAKVKKIVKPLLGSMRGGYYTVGDIKSDLKELGKKWWSCSSGYAFVHSNATEITIDGTTVNWSKFADVFIAEVVDAAVKDARNVKPVSTAKPLGWKTGKPKKHGSYVCAVKYNPNSDKLSRRVMWWHGAWCVNDNPSTKIDDEAGVAVLGWIALPEEDPE